MIKATFQIANKNFSLGLISTLSFSLDLYKFIYSISLLSFFPKRQLSYILMLHSKKLDPLIYNNLEKYILIEQLVKCCLYTNLINNQKEI